MQQAVCAWFGPDIKVAGLIEAMLNRGWERKQRSIDKLWNGSNSPSRWGFVSSSCGPLIFLSNNLESGLFKDKLHLCCYCCCSPQCLTDVTGVDFIHVHKGSPTLGSPRRRLLLVCAMATTTNKGQSPMLMANWVCSHYWLSKQWSTDGRLALPAQLTLQTFRRLGSDRPSAHVFLYITPSHTALA